MTSRGNTWFFSSTRWICECPGGSKMSLWVLPGRLGLKERC